MRVHRRSRESGDVNEIPSTGMVQFSSLEVLAQSLQLVPPKVPTPNFWSFLGVFHTGCNGTLWLPPTPTVIMQRPVMKLCSSGALTLAEQRAADLCKDRVRSLPRPLGTPGPQMGWMPGPGGERSLSPVFLHQVYTQIGAVESFNFIYSCICFWLCWVLVLAWAFL